MAVSMGLVADTTRSASATSGDSERRDPKCEANFIGLDTPLVCRERAFIEKQSSPLKVLGVLR
jgi:hypothetical protein